MSLLFEYLSHSRFVNLVIFDKRKIQLHLTSEEKIYFVVTRSY